MSQFVESYSLRPGQDQNLIELTQPMAGPGVTDALRFQRHENGVTVQISGTATSIEAVVERSAGTAADLYSPAGPAIVGSPAEGISPYVYLEPGRAFWRVRIRAITGGSVVVYMLGEQG